MTKNNKITNSGTMLHLDPGILIKGNYRKDTIHYIKIGNLFMHCRSTGLKLRLGDKKEYWTKFEVIL